MRTRTAASAAAALEVCGTTTSIEGIGSVSSEGLTSSLRQQRTSARWPLCSAYQQALPGLPGTQAEA